MSYPGRGAVVGTRQAVGGGYTSPPRRAVGGIEGGGVAERLDTLTEEMRRLREDNQRLIEQLAPLQRLGPLLERLEQMTSQTMSIRSAEPSDSGAARPARINALPQPAQQDRVAPATPDRSLGASPERAPSVSAPAGGATAEAGPFEGSPEQVHSEMRIWTGTWNMGAKDPFQDKNVTRNMDLVERLLEQFIPLDYDLYVLGVQEGVSDSIFQAVAAFTGCFQLPLYAKLEPAREGKESAVRSRRMGRAICVQEFIDDFNAGRTPDPVISMADMLDRVWGRGDGAIFKPKFTGIAVFVHPSAAPYVRLLGVYKHSFGASEGSKGGVGVALGVYDQSIAFVNAHMASKRIEMRRQQYCDLVERLGAKLGGRGFQLTEEFHHVIWMGDLNYHCSGIDGSAALGLLRQGRVADLLIGHDELIQERNMGRAFYGFEEPTMPPDFLPTYKKMPNRGFIDYDRDPEWPNRVYQVRYREPFYKGGREMDRIPSWCDRIQFHSLPSRRDELLPELMDPDDPDSPHNYRAVNDGMDISDHSPVFATWRLRITLDRVDDDAMERAMAAGAEGILMRRGGAVGLGTIGVDPELLHPTLRPLSVVLTVSNVKVAYRGKMRSPRALSMLFPLPFEDGDQLPERAKVVRSGTLMSMAPRSETRDGISGGVSCLVTRANKLPRLHLLIKISLDDNTKAQAVTSMAECDVREPGRYQVTKFLPLMRNGLRATAEGYGHAPSPLDVQIEVEVFANFATHDQLLAAAARTHHQPSSPAGASSPAFRSRAESGFRGGSLGSFDMDLPSVESGEGGSFRGAARPGPAAARELGFDDEEDIIDVASEDDGL